MSSTEHATPGRPAVHWDESPFSLLGAAAVFLEGRRVLVGSMLSGGLLAVAIVSLLPPRYTAHAMFMPESRSESDLGGLAGIAGQFGLPTGSGSTSPSPEFYASIAESPVILSPIAGGSFSVSGDSATARTPLVALLDAKGDTEERRRERATEKLEDAVFTSFDRRTGVISLRVRTRWPGVSEAVATQILARLNEFNLETRQSRARSERIFAEARTQEARARLTAAEDELRRFLMANRSVQGSPRLTLEVDRRQREIGLAQQILGSLESSLEDARLREVKDTPVITVLQNPTVLSVSDPRGRVKFGIFGAVLGFLIGSVVVVIRHSLRRARTEDDPQVQRFFSALADSRRDVRGIWTRRPSGSRRT